MSKVVPGFLPPDGTRINVQDVLDTFVGGTRIFDFNVENFADSAMSFMLSQTEAPTAAQLHRGLLWFKRGTGRMYRWVPLPIDSGATGSWVANSVRREQLIQMRHPVVPGEVLWSDPSPSEYKVHAGESTEFLYTKLSGAEHSFTGADSNATAAAHWADMKTRPVPPFFVANESVAASNFGVVTELGFVRAQYTGAGQLGCVVDGVNVPYLTGLSAGFATESTARIAELVDSDPGATQMIVFLHQGPSNLCR
jgi:hypothetical protein